MITTQNDSDVLYRPSLFSGAEGPIENYAQVQKYAVIYHLLMDYPLNTILTIGSESFWLQ